MKILKYVCFSLLGIIVVVFAAVVIFVSTFDLNKYLNPITAEASKMLGRKVVVEQASLRMDLFKGINLTIKNAAISEHEQYGTGEFFRLGNLTASVDAMAFISKREVVLTSITLSDLYVHLIRDNKGGMNIGTIGAATSSTGGSVSQGNVAPSAAAPIVLPVMLVKNFTMKDSTIIFDDTSGASPLHVTTDAIQLKVDNVAITGNNNVQVSADIHDLSFNIETIPVSIASIKPEIILDLSKPSLNGHFKVDLSGGEITKLNLTTRVLSTLEPIPVIGPMLSEILKTGLGDIALENKTIIRQINLKSEIINDVMGIQTLRIDAAPLYVDAQGKVDIKALSLDVGVQLRLAKDLSAKLVGAVKPLGALVNEQQEFTFPGKVSGLVPKIVYLPDVGYISKKVATNEATNALGQQLDQVIEKNPEVGSILNAVLGGKSSEGASTDPESSKKMINGFLNKIIQ